MKRISLFLLALIVSLGLLTACGSDTPDEIPESPAVSDESDTPAATETEPATEAVTETEPVTEAVTETAAEDETTAQSEPSANPDNFPGTPAYTVDGDSIIVDGVAYPNLSNFNCGPLLAVDDLGRILPTAEATGGYTSEEKYVGMFYFLGNGYKRSGEIYDISKILAEGGAAAQKTTYEGWGPVNATHFWGEPLYNYYFMSDTWVIRKHIEMLTNANVDFLFFDCTNGISFVAQAKSVMKIIGEFMDDGYDAPQVVFYTRTDCAKVVQEVYNMIYAREYEPETWFCLDGKPVIVTVAERCKNLDCFDFFTIKESQWPTEPPKRNGWPWMDYMPTTIIYKGTDGRTAMNVSVAQHNGTVMFSDSAIYGNRTNRGRSWHNNAHGITEDSVLYGYNFQEQWANAIRRDPDIVLVTGWNEWTAARLDPFTQGRNDRVNFLDACDIEYSRDIEPMAGGYFDNYYMQLVDNVRRYKGTAPTLVQDTRKAIDLTGGFDQWNDILVTYTDVSGDTVERASAAYGNQFLRNSTGQNDITASKIVYDTKNVYFYVETADAITPWDSEGSWMQLFLNTDMEQTGFYGYDYIVNYNPTAAGKTTVAKCTSTDNSFAFEDVAEVSFTVEGNKMMIAVPLETLGITDWSRIMFTFKWVDSKSDVNTMELMYSDGDCAPLGRLNYVFQNYKESTSDNPAQ